ncbi:MAG: MBL fold metallo-hydrolase [Cyanobacteria bacterium J06648_11]
MERRRFLQLASGLAGGVVAGRTGVSWAQESGLTLTWLNHSCVLLASGGRRILVNPFRPVGCTEGYPAPDVEADLVLLSSQLLDEGSLESVPGDPRVLFEPGDFDIDGLKFKGVRMDHDTNNGFRFGTNVAWRWTMGGVNIVHLGGAAAPITREQNILLDRPDVIFVPVGGGPKNYDAPGAIAAIEALSPKLVIPTMFRASGASESCMLASVDAFLSGMSSTPVTRLDSTQLALSPSQFESETMRIAVFAA